ncbi:MAG: 2-C-methyl-D-erythritol 4-phosphate cytidylyltransferase [Nitrospirota bacterium]
MDHKKGKIAAIVPAAGVGKRFGQDRNKSLYELAGKPLLIWVLEALQGVGEIDEIVPVLKGEDIAPGAALIEQYGITKVKRVIPGGRERQDSVYNGLKALDGRASVVAIHDGARPLADAELIRRTLRGLGDFDGAVAAVPVKDTIKEGKLHRDEEGSETNEIVVRRTLDRAVLWAIQTPQTFYLEKLRNAHEKARADEYYATDDAALVEKYGGLIRIVEGSYRNIKVTTPEDIAIAEALLKCR